MKKALFLLTFFSATAMAGWDFDNSGSRTFDMRKNESKSVQVTIESVNANDIQKACDAKSKQMGFGGFNYTPLACSFWRGKTCHVIMPHNVDMRTVGHEVMHCFQGDWHVQPK